MSSRGIQAFAAALAVLLLFLGAAASRVPASGRLQGMLAQELAFRLQREVAVGPLQGNAIQGYSVHGLAIAGPQGLARGAFARADRLGVRLSWWRGLATGHLEATLTEIRLQSPELVLSRDAQGRWNIPTWRAAKSGRPSRPIRTNPRLVLEGARLRLSDARLAAEDGSPLKVSLENGAFAVDLADLVKLASGKSSDLSAVVLAGHVRALWGPQAAEGDLARDPSGLLLRDLRMSDGAVGDAISARSIRLRLGGKPSGGKESPLQTISGLDLEAPVVRLSRAADGSFSLMRQVRPYAKTGGGKPLRVGGQLRVTDGSLQYTDHSLTRAGQSLVLSAEHLQLGVDLVALQKAMGGKSRAPAGELKANLRASCATWQAGARLDSDLISRLTLTELVSTDAGALVCSTPRLSVQYRGPLLAGKVSALSMVDLGGLQANIVLDRRNHPVFLPISAHSSGGPGRLPLAGGRWVLRNGDVAVTVGSLQAAGSPLRLRLRQLTADLRPGVIATGRGASAGTLDTVVSANWAGRSAVCHIAGPLGNGPSFTGLVIRQGRAPVLQVASGRIAFDPARLARSPAQALRLVSLRSPRASLTRDADGVLSVLRPFTNPRRRARGPMFPPVRVQVSAGSLALVDRARPVGLNRVRLDRVSADLDLARLGAALKGRAGGFGRMSAHLAASGSGAAAVADLAFAAPGRLEARNVSVTARGQSRLRLAQGTVGFALPALGRGDLGRAFTSLSLRAGQANVLRERDGQWELLRLLDGRRPQRTRGGARPVRFALPAGVPVSLDGVRVQVADSWALDGPAVVTVSDLKGKATVGRASRGSVTGRVQLSSRRLQASAQVHTDLASAVGLSNASADVLSGRQRRPVLRAASVSAGGSLAPLVGGNPVAALKGLTARGYTAEVLRQKDGQLEWAALLRGFSRPAPVKPVPLPPFRAQVRSQGGAFTFIDQSVATAPVRVEAKDLRADVNLGALADRAAGRGRGRDPGWAQAQVTLSSPQVKAAARLAWHLAGNLEFSDLSADRLKPSAASLIRVASGRVEYSLARLMGAHPVEGVHLVSLIAPDLTVNRFANGDWELLELIAGAFSRPGQATPEREWGVLAAEFIVRDGRLSLRDEHTTRGGPLVAQVTGINGHANGQKWLELDPAAPPADLGALEGAFSASWPGAEAAGVLVTDLVSSAELRGFSLRAAGPGPFLSGRLARAQFSIEDLLTPDMPTLAALREASVTGLQGHVTRLPDGSVDLASLFDAFATEPSEPGAQTGPSTLESLRGRVHFADSALQYTDQSRPQQPVTVAVQGAAGSLDLSRLVQLGHPEDLAGLGSYVGEVTVATPRVRLAAHVDSPDLSRSATLADLIATDVRTGRTQASVRRAEVELDLAAALRDRDRWAASLSRCSLNGPHIELERKPDGTWDVSDLFVSEPSADASTATWEQLRAGVDVADGSVLCTDRALSDGPAQWRLEGLEGHVDMSRVQEARAGRWQPGLGTLAGALDYAMPAEAGHAAFDWDLDRRVALRDVSVTRPDEVLPVATLGRGSATYDAAQAFAHPSDWALSVDDAQVSGLWLRLRRITGGWEALRAVSAYTQAQEAPSQGQAALERMRARVQFSSCAVAVEDLITDPQRPWQALLSGAEGDVRLDRLAQLRAGNQAADAGWLRAGLSAHAGEVAATGLVDADLSGSVQVRDAVVTRGPATLLSADRADVAFAPESLLGPTPGLAALRAVTIERGRGDVELDEAGRWELASLLPAATETETKGRWRWKDFGGVLQVTDSALKLRNRRPDVASPLLAAVDANDITGGLDFRNAGDGGVPASTGLSANVRLASADTTLAARITTDLRTSAQVQDLRAVTTREGGPRELLSAREAKVLAPLGRWLEGAPAGEGLQRVEVWDLRAEVRREEGGRWELQRYFGGLPGVPTEPQPTRLSGTVVAHNADVTYRDDALDVAGGVAVRAIEVKGTVDLAALSTALDGQPASGLGTLSGRLGGHYGDYTLSGALTTDGASTVEVRDLLARRRSNSEPILAATRFSARGDIPRLLHSNDPAGLVQEVLADGLSAHILRTPGGRLELAGAVPARGTSGSGAGGGFVGRVVLADSQLRFTDLSTRADAPVEVFARGVEGTVDVGAVQAMRRDGVTRGCGSLACSLEARGRQATLTADLTSDLAHEARMKGLAFLASADSAQESLAARDCTLQYDAGPLLAGQDWGPHVQLARARDLTASLTREPDGGLRAVRLVLEDLNRTARGPRAPKPQRTPDLRGRLQLVDATVDYVDEALLTQGPLTTHARGINADLDFSEGAVRTSVPSGPLQAEVELLTPAERLVARVSGDLSQELEARGLQILRQDGTRVLTARRAALAADLRAAIQAPANPLNWVRGVALDGLDGTLQRDHTGQITSPQVLSLRTASAAHRRPPSAESVTAALLGGPAYLALSDCRLTLEDDALLGGGERLRVAVTDVGGRVRLQPDASDRDGWRTEGTIGGHLQAQAPSGTLATAFETDLARSFALRNLTGLDATGTETARGGLVSVSYRLDRGLQGTPWAQCLTGLQVHDLQAQAATDSAGRLLVAGLPVGRGIVGRSGSLGDLRGLQAQVQTDERGVLRGSLRTDDSGTLLAAAEVDGFYDPVDGWLDLQARARSADLGLLGRWLLPQDTGTVSALARNVHGFAYGRPGQPGQFTWAAAGDASDGVLQLSALGDEPVRFSGPLSAGSEGVRSDDIRANWGPISGTVSGALLDLSAPCLALSVQAQTAQGADLLKALPAHARESLRSLSADAPVTMTANIAGPAADACAEILVRSAGEVMTRTEQVGTVRLAGLNLAASVVGWNHPSISGNATVTAAGVQSDAIPPGALPASEAHASFVSADGRGIGQVQVPAAIVRGVMVEDLQIAAAQDGGQWTAPLVHARLAGGQMVGRLAADLQGDEPAVRGRMDLTGVQLAQLAGADLWPMGWSAAGSVSARVSGTFTGPGTDCSADLQVQTPQVNGKVFEAMRALLTRKGTVTRVELAQVSDGPGRLWLRGTIADPEARGADYQADMDLAAAEFELGKLPLPSPAPDLGGYAYLAGHLQGPVRDPDLDLRAQAFAPQLDRARGDLLAVQLTRRGSRLTAPYLLLSAGRGALAATGLRVEQFRLRAPGSDALSPDGTIQAALLRGFTPVEDVARAIRQHSDTGGWLDLDGSVGGTLRRPTLESSLRADKLRLGDVSIDEARLPITLAGDRLLVSDGYVRAHGGELSLAGRIDDLYGRRAYSLAASLPGIAIEDIPTTHRLRLDASGTLAAPQIVVWGAADRKPSGSLVYQLSDVRIGSEELEPSSGWVQFAGDIVQVAATHVRRVGTSRTGGRGAEPGYLSASALYDTSHGLLDADLRAVGPTEEPVARALGAREIAMLPDVGAVLRLAAPVVAAVEQALANAGSPQSGKASHLLGQLGLRASGKLAGRARLVGPLDDLNCRAELGLYNARMDGKPLARVVRASLGADLHHGRIYDLDAEALEGRQYFTARGGLDLALNSPAQDSVGNVDLAIEGADIDLPMWRQWLPRSLPVGGTASFVFTADGPSRAPNIRGSLDVVNPSYAGARFDVLRLPMIEVGGDAIKVTRARLIRSESRGGVVVPREIAMSGSLPWSWQAPWIPPQGPVNFHAEFADIDLGFFPPILDEAIGAGRGRPDSTFSWARLETRGTVRASLDVKGTWGAPSLQGNVSLVGGAVRAPGWSRPWEDIKLNVSLDRQGEDNRALVQEASGRWGSLKVAAHDTWAVLGYLTPEGLARNQYHADLTVKNDQPLEIGGLQVGEVRGGMSLQTVPTPPETPNGPRTHELTFNDLAARMGTGAVHLSGWSRITSFLARDFHRNEYDLQLTSDDADVRYLRRLRGRLSGAIRMHRTTPPGGGPWAAQRVRVDGGLNLRNADLALSAPRGGEPVVLHGMPAWVPTPTFDVRLAAGEGVVLRGMGITVPVAPGEVARLTGSLQSPRVSGAVSAREGAVRVPTGALQIKQAKITYAMAPVGQVPQGQRADLALSGKVDIRGERLFTNIDVPGWGTTPLQVFVAVTGDIPNDIRVRLWSDPPLKEEQLLAMLGAEPLGGLTAGGEAETGTVSEQALNVLAAGFRATIFEPIESELMRLLQLSEFNVRFGFNQEVEVRLGKYLVKDLLVSYQHSVGGSGDDRYQLSLSYRLKNRVFVAYTTNERNENRVKLTYDVPFRRP
jgi:hypothetical protein